MQCLKPHLLPLSSETIMDEHACEQLPAVPLQPCSIVIFGGSGDLTRRKLIPALYSLYVQDRLPANFTVVGCSRTVMNDEQYRRTLYRRYLQEGVTLDRWQAFAAHLHYQPITYDSTSFQELEHTLRRLDTVHACGGNRLFDLAVPPQLYPVIAELLGTTTLPRQYTTGNGWARIVVEKPFGRDLATAKTLNATLHAHFQEEQIYRIDHYLAKETVQNMLVVRFANAIFEPIWNRSYIDSIHITAAEDLGAGGRAGYYEDSGVLRDMFQNHLMQLLVLTAMEPPSRLEAEAVQDEKLKVIRSLRDFVPDGGSRVVLGQYTAGTVDATSVPGYREEEGVDPHSTTPTYALLETFVDNWRWQGVPFYLTSGKRLMRKETKIVIQFKEVPHRLFHNSLGDSIRANQLTIETYPQEAIRLSFQTKNPGAQLCLRSMEMDFVYREHYRKQSLDAYARVLLDCIAGDHMLFWRQDGIEASWAFLTPILEDCEQCEPEKPLHFYPAGSQGPEYQRNDLP